MPGVETFANSLEKRDGGKTISRRALVEVVNGWPPESRVSSSSYQLCASDRRCAR